ncbi:hypothetical protein EUX98_g3401 [Antrodiella citrinella]|uniref:Transmembrane protein n=1 Tax=Antrodiella citrinella TaxID=2447956 RepID=A0A4S4N4S1_9APHY|nr:hypothetical protein EUX98_g3401 [Antrodiella citrinella]
MPNTIVLYFTPRQHPDIELPFALRGYCSQEVWEKRLPAFVRKASRFHHMVFEWVWFAVFIAAMIGVPIAMYQVAWDKLPEDKDEKEFGTDNWWSHNSFDRAWKCRLISFASWLAVTLLCYIPIITWKTSGKNAVNKMLKQWEEQDKALKPNQAVPVWRMRTPGFLSNQIKLVIDAPGNPPFSSFHPNSNLPPYIVNGPLDPNAAYYYQPMGGYPNAPVSAPNYNASRPSDAQYPAPPPTSVSGLPLFNGNDEKQGGYIPPLDPNADPEKQEAFENIRV